MTGSRTSPHRRRTRERGAAVVEFALVLPLFLALVFGIISYGWMLSYRQSISQAAAEGARAVAVAPNGTPNLGAVATAAVNRSLSSYGVTCEGGAMRHDGATVGSCTIPASSTTCPAPNPSRARCVTVTLAHRYRANPLIPSFPGLGLTLPSELRFASTVEVS